MLHLPNFFNISFLFTVTKSITVFKFKLLQKSLCYLSVRVRFPTNHWLIVASLWAISLQDFESSDVFTDSATGAWDGTDYSDYIQPILFGSDRVLLAQCGIPNRFFVWVMCITGCPVLFYLLSLCQLFLCGETTLSSYQIGSACCDSYLACIAG